MLEPLDRYSRDSTLFQFTTKRLRDFIDPNHLLFQIDEHFDFAKLVAPLESKYCSDNGRPAIHPEVLVRALLISALYNITSFRRLCLAISENIAFRWFCFLTIDAEVFDHSTITYFIERIGREGFKLLFQGFNQELLRMGLLSAKMYADSTLVKANVSNPGLRPSGMTVSEFREKAIRENDLFAIKGAEDGGSDIPQKRIKYYQDAQGHLCLSSVDPDARWRTSSSTRMPQLCYQENEIVDKNGFILARMVTPASEAESKALPRLLDGIPLEPETLAADTAYSAGSLRQNLEERGITAYIPIHPNQDLNVVTQQGFSYHGDYLVCPQGRILRRRALERTYQTHKYVARRKDCRACSLKQRCLPPKQEVRLVRVSAYHPVFERARELNRSSDYGEEMRRRKAVVEGVFACLDRLGWSQCKLRGLWKVDCEGFLAALAHNILKAIRRLKVTVNNVGCNLGQSMEIETILS